MEEIDLLRRRVVNVVGHELRTPITTLCGLAEQIADASPDDVRELGPAIERNARRVERLLDDLLVAAEINTALPVGGSDVIEVVRCLTDSWAALGEEGDHLVLEGDAAARVLVHATSPERIFAHVLDNARKYGRPPVRARVERTGDHVDVAIHSFGEPPAENDLLLAFELFFRGERAVTTSPGLGIGLPVARALARHDGGEVTIEAEADGVLVRVRLPAASAP
jgi:signal transduction histidine kinase